MRRRRKTSSREVPHAVKLRCDHVLAAAVDPTDNEPSMPANCPNRGRWMPGDEPIWRSC